MPICKFFLFNILLFLGIVTFAQDNKGDIAFNNGDFSAAIKAFKNDTSKNDLSYIKLAQSYNAIFEYKQAEIVFTNYFKKYTNPFGSAYIEYANTLNFLGKHVLAKKQLNLYKIKNSNYASNVAFRESDKNTDDLLRWSILPEKYKTSNLKSLNTNRTEFSLIPFNNGYIYCTDRNINLQDASASESPFTSVFYGTAKKIDYDNIDIKDLKLFNKKLISDYNIGPVCISNDGKNIYYNKSESRSVKRQKPINKLYVADITYNEISNIKAFEYNNESYSILHPSVNNDNTILYFSSDMPGGFGGFDIYYCKKENNVWSKPINIGNKINSSKNEIFPFISDKGLYFSSNGLMGYGGLDIFYIQLNDSKNNLPVNLKWPINSAYDDVSFYLADDDSIGYFSSNRPGGKGSDDIYAFKINSNINYKSGRLAYEFENKLIEIKNAEITILEPNGDVLQKTKTNENGVFTFENIIDESYYAINLKNNVEIINIPSTSIVIINDSNIVERRGETKDIGILFRYNDLDKLLKKNIEEAAISKSNLSNKTFKGIVLRGSDTSKAIPELRISLFDSKNNLIQTRNTQINGIFTFNNLSSSENYSIEIDKTNDYVMAEDKIFVKTVDLKNIITVFYKNETTYNFKILTTDKNYFELLEDNDETRLLNNIIANFTNAVTNEPIKNATMKLLSSEGEILQIVKTNYDGSFRFNNIDPSSSFYVLTDVKDSVLKNVTKCYVKNQYGEKIYELSKLPSGIFRFSFLPYEKKRATMLEEIDVTLNVSLPGKITAANGGSIVGLKVYLFDKNEKLVQTVVTNEKGIYKFRGLNANEKYIIRIDTNNIKVKNESIKLTDLSNNVIYESVGGKFQFNYLPSYGATFNKLDETDNTQIISKIRGSLKDKSGKPLANVSMNLYDKTGKLVSTIKTNDLGVFEFYPLDKLSDYKIELDKTDPNYKSLSNVVLYDYTGQKITEGSKESFNYKVLISDRNTMAVYDETDDSKLITRIKGAIKSADNNPYKDVKLLLIDNKNAIINTTRTNILGEFSFTSKQKRGDYNIILDSTDKNYASVKSIVLYDRNGNKILESNDKEKFNFSLLGTDRSSMTLYEDIDNTLLISKIRGKIKNEDNIAIANGGVLLLNYENGTIIANTKTNTNGDFEFNTKDKKQNFQIKIDKSDPAYKNVKKVVLYDGNGNKVIEGSKETFKYNLLISERSSMAIYDETDNSELVTEMTGKILDLNDSPLQNGTLVYLKDKNGQIISETKLTEGGNFTFKKIPSDKNYYLEIANINETQLKLSNGFKLIDNSNKLNKSGYFDNKGCFVFNILSNDRTYFNKISDEGDVALKVVKTKEQIVKEKLEAKELAAAEASININNIKKLDVLLKATSADSIYFLTNEFVLNEVNKEILNKLVLKAKEYNTTKIQISTYADQRASEQYNLILTQKRLKSVVAYLKYKGMDEKNIVGYAKGAIKQSEELNTTNKEETAEFYKLSRKAVISIIK